MSNPALEAFERMVRGPQLSHTASYRNDVETVRAALTDTMKEFREALSDIRYMPGATPTNVKGGVGTPRREAVERVIGYVNSEHFASTVRQRREEFGGRSPSNCE